MVTAVFFRPHVWEIPARGDRRGGGGTRLLRMRLFTRERSRRSIGQTVHWPNEGYMGRESNSEWMGGWMDGRINKNIERQGKGCQKEEKNG